MAIDDNANYTLTGAQVKDLASKVKASDPLIIYTSAAIGNAFQTYSDDNLTVVITGAQIGAAFKAGRQIILTTDTIAEPTATIVAFTEGPEDMFTCVVDNTTYRYGYKSAQNRWVAVSRTVNDGTLTIQKNGTDVATFTANSSTNATANISVPTQFSDLSGTVSTSQIANGSITGGLLDYTSAAGTAVIKTITDNSGRTGIYFADGTLITYRKVQHVGPINTAWGSLYEGHTTDYYKFAPTGGADFIAEPNVQVTLLNNSASGSCWMGAWENSVQIVSGGWAIPAGALCFIRASAYVPNITLNLYIQAIGKWK